MIQSLRAVSPQLLGSTVSLVVQRHNVFEDSMWERKVSSHGDSKDPVELNKEPTREMGQVKTPVKDI